MSHLPELDPTSYDAYQLIQAVSDRLADVSGEDYRLVGGYPTAIMLDPDTHFDHDATIVKAGGGELPILRGNNTKKDFDYVLMTDDGDKAREVERQLNDEFGEFGHTVSIDRLRKPGIRRLGFVGSQVIAEDGTCYMQLGPIQQEVPPETLQAWQTIMPEGGTVRTWHPITQLMMYEARSLTGIRHKDQEKQAQLRERLLGVEQLAQDYSLYEPWMAYIRAVSELDFANVFPLRGESGVIALNGLAKKIVAWGESKKEIVEAFQRDSGIVDKVQRWGINR